MPSRPLDPATPLSLARAARAAGVGVEELERRIDAGELLFEGSRGRAKGKDAVVVRAVDLASLYPTVRLRGGARPGPPRSASPSAASPRAEPARPERDAPDPLPSGVSTPSAAPSTGDLSTGDLSNPQGPDMAVPQERDPGSPATDLLAARLDAIEMTNGDLRTQVADLRSQRQDLVSQCDDLRTRLDRAEHERQASTAGLMLAQKRLLELEAPVVQMAPPWRRRATYGLGAAVVVLGLFLRQQVVRAGDLADHVEGLRGDVRAKDERIESLGDQLPELTRALGDLDDELQRSRTAAREDRAVLVEAIEQQRRAREAAELRARAQVDGLETDHAEALAVLSAERDGLVREQDALRERMRERDETFQRVVDELRADLATLAERPVPRAATGFLGRLRERLEDAQVSQDVSADG